jgi:hypothetical protein
MFCLWRRIGEEGRPLVWRLYGWFSGLMFCGSGFGAVTYGFWMQREVAYFSSISRSNDSYVASQRSSNSFKSQSERSSSVYVVSHAIEFLCLSTAQLLILDRMTDFAFPDPQGMKKRLRSCKLIGLAAVLAANLVGLCANTIAAVKFAKASEYYETALVGDISSDSNTNVGLARTANQSAHTISSIQMFCEVIVVLLIVIAFAVVGAACARRVRTALVGNSVDKDVNAAGRRLHIRIVCTSTVVFLAFLFRSLFSTTYAVVSQLQNVANANICPDPPSPSFYCSESCFNTYTRIWVWMVNTAELEMAVAFVSSPLALLVSLWGMTSDRMLQLVRALKTKHPHEMNSIL